jgi:hypothetical protein
MEETKKQKEGHEEGKTEYRRQKKTCKRNTERRKNKKRIKQENMKMREKQCRDL